MAASALNKEKKLRIEAERKLLQKQQQEFNSPPKVKRKHKDSIPATSSSVTSSQIEKLKPSASGIKPASSDTVLQTLRTEMKAQQIQMQQQMDTILAAMQNKSSDSTVTSSKKRRAVTHTPARDEFSSSPADQSSPASSPVRKKTKPGTKQQPLNLPGYDDSDHEGKKCLSDSSSYVPSSSDTDIHKLDLTQDDAVSLMPSDQEFQSETEFTQASLDNPEFSDEAPMPSETETIADSPVRKQKETSNRKLWEQAVFDVAVEGHFPLGQHDTEPVIFGESPDRAKQRYQLPPSRLQESLLQRIKVQLVKDMAVKTQSGSTKEATYMNVFPRPPKFSNQFLHVGEEFGGKDRWCRSHVNAHIQELYSDSYGAGNSTGHCTLDSKHSTLVESALGWQRHHLAYQEQFLGNARIKLKSVISDMQSEVDKDEPVDEKSNLGKLLKAQASINQTMILLKNHVVPTTLYVSTRLEVGRRDSFIDRMNKNVQDETLMEMRGSRFPVSVQHPTFEPSTLVDARRDIKKGKKRSSSTYKGWTERGGKQKRQRIDSQRSRGRGGGYNNNKRNKQKKQFQYDSSAQNNQRGGGSARGGGKPNIRKPNRGGGNSGNRGSGRGAKQT